MKLSVFSNPVRSAFRAAGAEIVYNRLVSPFFRQTKAKWSVAGLATTNLLIASGGVFFNSLYGQLIDHLSQRNWPGFVSDVGVFSGYCVALVGVTAARGLIDQKTALSWRNWIRREMHADWFSPEARSRHVASSYSEMAQVGQRMTDDVSIMVGSSQFLAVDGMRNVCNLTFFGTVLWGLSPLLLAGAAALSGVGIAVAWRSGHKLQTLDHEQARAYNDYRNGITTANAHRQAIGLWGGEAAEKVELDRKQMMLSRVISRRINVETLVGVVNTAIGTVSQISPFVFGSGAYFKQGSQVTIGEMSQGAGASNLFSGSLQWFAQTVPQRNYWVASVKRLAGFLRLQDEVKAAVIRPRFEGGDQLSLSVSGLNVGAPGNPALCSDVNLSLVPGDRVALVGDSGCGKTTLLRQLAGAAPIEKGDVVFKGVHGRENVLFVPQEAYIPDMQLKEILCYPRSAAVFSDAEMRAALIEVGLDKLAGQLEDRKTTGRDYTEQLSGGEKQRLNFARLLLHKPAVIGLDEATSALPEKDGVALYKTLIDRLPDSIIISTVHRRELIPLHTCTAVMSQGHLTLTQSQQPAVSSDAPSPALVRLLRIPGARSMPYMQPETR